MKTQIIDDEKHVFAETMAEQNKLMEIIERKKLILYKGNFYDGKKFIHPLKDDHR